VLGRQVGSKDPPTLEAYRASGEKRYHHDIASMQRLWDVIGERTGTKWVVSGDMLDFTEEAPPRVIIRFAVRKVE